MIKSDKDTEKGEVVWGIGGLEKQFSPVQGKRGIPNQERRGGDMKGMTMTWNEKKRQT